MTREIFGAKLHTEEPGIEAAGVGGGLHTTVVVDESTSLVEVQQPAPIATSATTTSSSSAVKHVPEDSTTSKIVRIIIDH